MQIIYKALVSHSCTWANLRDISYFTDNLTLHRDWVEVTEIRKCKTLHTPKIIYFIECKFAYNSFYNEI